jgi:nitrogen-specific signal transduction histidine kinase/DNA-binding response OmpR family regulator/HPt (histidine-containing phosphotransfer) domain-containing protein
MTPDKNYTPDQFEELKETIDRLKSENLRLEKLAEQADAANKAKSDFLAMISHEIRTPMNGVIGLTELMLDMEQDSKQKKYTGLILTSARNLLTLINSLLDFSKIEADMMELDITEFNLRKMVGELMTLYNVATVRKDVQVYSEIDPAIPEFFIGDSYRIRQILVNLLGNAIKFTDVGSVVLKVIYIQHSDDGTNLLRFEVRDSGPGIPPDKLDRLFKPFTQVDASSTRRYGGTGLGLSICQKLVELMKGEIGVNSGKGKGSTFWFALPLKPGVGKLYDSQPVLDQEIEIPVIDEDESVNSEAVPKESIDFPLFMVVDDDETNRFVLKTVLLKSGARVITARNGEEAIDLFRSNAIELILMDCQMPVMDGFEASKLIQEKAVELSRKKPCIIALTADATQSTKQLCKEVGMDDYLTKPLEFGRLQRVIDNWLPGSGLQIISHHQQPEHEDRMKFCGDGEFQGVQIDSRVLERLKRNIGNVSSVIKVFLGSMSNRLDDLKKAVDNSDYEEIRRISHTLKGSSSQFGAIYMSNLCHQAENLAKSERLENINALYGKIIQAAKQVADFLSEELD